MRLRAMSFVADVMTKHRDRRRRRAVSDETRKTGDIDES
jgi:hypothetical protein